MNCGPIGKKVDLLGRRWTYREGNGPNGKEMDLLMGRGLKCSSELGNYSGPSQESQ